MNREVTPKQRKLIRIWLYSPILIAFIGLSIALFIRTKFANPVPLFFLTLVALAMIAIVRKVETSMRMVIPTKEEITFFIFFAVFYVAIKSSARYYMHPNDWVFDMTYNSAATVMMAPLLFFRKIKPEKTVEGHCSPPIRPIQ